MKPDRAKRTGLREFLFPSANDEWISFLRTGLAVQVLIYCLSLRADWTYLFAGTGRGLLSRELSEVAISSESAFIPRLGWLVQIGSRVGLDETSVLWASWLVLLLSALLLLAGVFSRASVVTVWFVHLCSVKSGGLLSYGMDSFTTIGLFYLMLSPLPDRRSLDHVVRGLKTKAPEYCGFFRRILQLHLCMIYFFSGITKCLGPGWWNGDSLWRALVHPPFDVIPPDTLLKFSPALVPAGIVACLLETAYPVFIWPRRTRSTWLVAVIGMHIVIAFSMGMYLFSLILIILNVAAWAPPQALRKLSPDFGLILRWAKTAPN